MVRFGIGIGGCRNPRRPLSYSLFGWGEKRMRKNARGVLRQIFSSAALVAVAALGPAREARAWGSPHGAITRAALAVQPEMARWRAEVGADNLAILVAHSDLPDRQGEDVGTFHADDYLLTRQVPVYPGHRVPAALQPVPAYFRRALQALRTETPVNALRQLCPLIHFVEDVGAPPHARPNDTHHVQLENGPWEKDLSIAGYVPVVLGANEADAEAEILRRLRELAEFSAVRCDRGLQLLLAPGARGDAAEPAVLEAAQETARATADILHTVFTLGLAAPRAGVSLSGRVTGSGGRDARIVLLDTDYATLALPDGTGGPANRFVFFGLPPGEYRALAACRGCLPKVQTVRLAQGQEARLDFELVPSPVAGNLMENPEAAVSTIQAGVPDRWRCRGSGAEREWRSAFVTVRSGVTYRLGAALKDPEARVTFVFTRPYPPKDFKPQEVALEKGASEVKKAAGNGCSLLYVSLKSPRPLGEVIERVWAVKD